MIEFHHKDIQVAATGRGGVSDGGVDINDLLFFLTHYEAGC